jgi:pyruvate formate lyase activating enzyme
MRIAGFQKISLLDYPGTPCAILFTQGCSFRCRFCHNPELIPAEGAFMIAEDDIVAKLNEHKKMVDAITITGGEPTLHPDLPIFIKRLKDEGYKVKLDTNGTNPEMVKGLIASELIDYIAMDLKNVWERYDLVTNTGSAKVFEKPKETFAIIQNSSVPHEFRTTILPGAHTPEDFTAMAGYMLPGEKYFIQDTKFDITLDPSIPHERGFDLDTLVASLRAKYPELMIEKR